MSTREIFRNNLKFYRKQAGLTQEELSEKIGYGYTYITEIESRHKFPKPETIDLIAETLKIEPGKLFEQIRTENNIFMIYQMKSTKNSLKIYIHELPKKYLKPSLKAEI